MFMNEISRNPIRKTSHNFNRERSQFTKTLPFKLEGFDLLYLKYANGETIITAWDKDLIVLELSLEPIVCFKIRAYSVEYANVHIDYQGKGLGLALYKALLNNLDFTLVSIDSHSVGARKLWVKLNQDQNINVYGFDLQTKMVFQVESNGSNSELIAKTFGISLYDSLNTGLMAMRTNNQDNEIMKVCLKQSEIKFK